MSNTDTTARISAEDLRGSLRLIFQPAMTSNARNWGTVLTYSVNSLLESGVTVKRLENAFAVVSVEDWQRDQFMTAFRMAGGK